jgi:lipopolysaccharide export system protein LptC
LAVNLRQYIRDNRTMIAIVILGVLAPASWILERWVAGPPAANDFVGPPVSDYILINSQVWSYDDTGALSFIMRSPHIDRRGFDEAMFLNTPVFSIKSKKPGVPDWQGNAPHGEVNKSGTIVNLTGNVYMERPAYAQGPMATLCTSDVTGWPKENRMETAAPATMTQGATVMNGVGMRANLNENHLELLHDVHGTLYSSQLNTTAKPVNCRDVAPAFRVGAAG